jgi:hypothetical protein
MHSRGLFAAPFSYVPKGQKDQKDQPVTPLVEVGQKWDALEIYSAPN